jgi:hypothetical protein
MSSATLSDLDELLVTIRERESRRLIEEAIAAYRGGALRSAIVATWIAVVADLFAKIRETATGGDRAAFQYITELDSAIEKNLLPKLQEIERGLLDKASNDFGLFTPHERKDLERLLEDRHMCAHPALVRKEFLFQPTPELVRAHIVHAIQHVLSKEPVQGKTILDQIFKDLLSQSFPTDKEQIRLFMKGKYLSNPRPALVRNLLEALFKIATGSERDFIGREDKVALSFATVGECQTALFDDYAPDIVRKVTAKLDADRLMYVPRVVSADPRIWKWLLEPQKVQISQLIRSVSVEELKQFGMLQAANVPELGEIIARRFGSLDRESKIAFLSGSPILSLKNEALELFASSPAFRAAESRMEGLILPYASYFDVEDILLILKAVEDNGQIHAASGIPPLMETFLDQTVHLLPKTKVYWNDFLFTMSKGKDIDDHYSFPGIRKRLKEKGMLKS